MLAPAGVGAGTVAARHPGARVFSITGTLRRLPPARAGARLALPVGIRQRQPPSVRERRREDDLVRDRGATRLAASRRRRLPRRERHAVREARAGILRADPRRPLQRAGAAACSRDRPRARARSQTRSPTTAASRASRRRPTSRHSPSATRRTATSPSAPRARRAARCSRSARRRSRRTPSCSPRPLGIEADCAGGAAFGALVEALRRGEIEPGAQVVLVVSGSAPRPEPAGSVRVHDDRPRRARRPHGPRPRLVALTETSPAFERDTAAPLRRDVRLLGTILGRVLVEQEGRVAARARRDGPPLGTRRAQQGPARTSRRRSPTPSRARRRSSCAPSASTSSSRTSPSSTTGCAGGARTHTTDGSRANRSTTRSAGSTSFRPTSSRRAPPARRSSWS